MPSLTALAAAVASAMCFGLASAGQHRVASSDAAMGSLDPRLLLRLARRPAWLVAGGLEVLAVGTQVLALRWGPVSLVQPLLVLGLPVAVLGSARGKGQRLSGREWTGVALCTVGVAVVAVALPGGHEAQARTGLGVLAPLAGVLVVAALAGQLAGGRRREVTGAAAGAVAGVGAASLTLCGRLLDQPGRLLLDWPPYVTVAAGLLALQLGQAAFQDERLGAPLGALTLAEPVVAVALSVVVLHEPLDPRPVLRLVSAAGVAAAAVGVALLVVRTTPGDGAADGDRWTAGEPRGVRRGRRRARR